jgi:hypothetical protein
VLLLLLLLLLIFALVVKVVRRLEWLLNVPAAIDPFGPHQEHQGHGRGNPSL